MNHIVGRVSRELRRTGAEYYARRPLREVADRPVVDVIVSLTTFPERIRSTDVTLKTLLRQSVRPKKLIVTLSAEQFAEVPCELSRYEQHGLTFILDHGDARSYKKLLPTRAAHPGATIVTADDDVLYPRDWLAQLVVAHEAMPKAVLGHRGTEIVGGRDDLSPYVAWPQADSRTHSARTFLTGMGGILYPPDALPEQAMDRDLAVALCPTGDDLWFKAMELLNRSTVRKISDRAAQLHGVRHAQRHSLRDGNVGQGQNDVQFRAVMDHFDLWGRLADRPQS